MSARKERVFRLADADLLAIGSHGIARKFPAGTQVVREGEATDALYIILEGSVRVTRSNGSGGEHTIATHGVGEYFGEMILDDGPHVASVVTEAPSLLMVVPKRSFRAFVVKNPPFALSLIAKLADRVRLLSESVKTNGA